MRIGIDTGGTFTDFVVLDKGSIRLFKLPSSPENPPQSLLKGLAKILPEQGDFLVQYGSTIATNALLERKGARTVLVTNQGFEDLVEIGRQNRPGLYDLGSSRPIPLVPTRLRVGLKERTLSDGQVLVPLEEKTLEWLRAKIRQLNPQSVAVILLYGYLNPENERRIGAALEDTRLPVSLSHRVLPEFREYERTSATVINAYLTPLVSGYLSTLASEPLMKRGRFTVMQSNGGSTGFRASSFHPIRTILSGPAGGVVGAFQTAKAAGYEKIITFDMGGTSTDVCLCDGEIPRTKESEIDHLPIPVQTVDIHTVGAGGGSIAWIDEGGLLRVGPQSAGAHPGPVCYGKGDEVTVTDANIFLGRMDADFFLGGDIKLFPEKIQAALENLARPLSQATGRPWPASEVAQGIISIVNTQMEGAIRVISLQRGYDTRKFTLFSFGGAAGLHACDLGRDLLIPRIVVPPDPGVLSAMGILRADVVHDASQTVLLLSDSPELAQAFERNFGALEEEVGSALVQDQFSDDSVILERRLEARYRGQAYEIEVPFRADFVELFHQKHEQFYGYCNRGLPVEVVNLRVRGVGRLPSPTLPRQALESETPPKEALVQEKQALLEGEERLVPFLLRDRLRPGNRMVGPAILLEYSSTVVVSPHFQARVDERLNVVLEPLS